MAEIVRERSRILAIIPKPSVPEIDLRPAKLLAELDPGPYLHVAGMRPTAADDCGN